MCVFPSGERYPALVRRDTGLPVYLPNLFIATQLRPNSFSSLTLECCQRALLLLLVFADSAGIDLPERIESGRMLAPHEVDALADAAQRHVRDLIAPNDGHTSRRHARLVDRLWAAGSSQSPSTELETTKVRLYYIRKYFEWWTTRRRGELIDRADALQTYSACRDQFLQQLKDRIPTGRNFESDREGLPPEYYQRVLDAVDPGSATPIWKLRSARIRNFVMFQFYWRAGLRDGEVRSLLVPDAEVGRDELWVERRPDPLPDPRRRAPAVKTDGRLLPLRGMGPLIEQYLFEVREQIPAARRHPYLFVAVRTGRPISSSAIGKVFRQLASAAGIPGSFSPHVLRHTWNDRYSDDQDAVGATEEQEQRSRNYEQGWSDNSQASRLYTKRHDRRRAFEALERMGRDLLRGSN
jgi:integrase